MHSHLEPGPRRFSARRTLRRVGAWLVCGAWLAVAGVCGVAAGDSFTQTFGNDNTDLTYVTLSLHPDGSDDFYRAGVERAWRFPTSPVGGTFLGELADVKYQRVEAPDGKRLQLYGESYSVFYVNANGSITFTGPDPSAGGTLQSHFAQPRIAAFGHDFDLALGGFVSWRALADRVVVTFESVVGVGYSAMMNSQIEMFFDGRIRITWLEMSGTSGTVGLSAGGGIPNEYVESKLSAYAPTEGLLVAPGEAFASGGFEGGPFAPESRAFVVTNSAAFASLDWSATTTASWCLPAPTSGTLAAGKSTTVSVALTGEAATLAPGLYRADLRFANRKSAFASVRQARLEVLARPGEIEVLDSIEPAADLALPFGDVVVGLYSTASLTVRNTDPVNPLTIRDISLYSEYFENFEAGVAQDWAPDYEANWTVAGGEYRAASPNDGYMVSKYLGRQWSDFSVHVTCRREGSQENAAALVVRATSDFADGRGSGYVFQFMPTGRFSVWKQTNGTWNWLQSWRNSPDIDPNLNLLTVSANGNRLQFFINGVRVWQGEDGAISSGYIGLSALSVTHDLTQHHFDNVFVTGPIVVGDEVDATVSGAIQILNAGFAVAGALELPWTIAPGASRELEVVYEPNDARAYHDTLVIGSNDIDEPQSRVLLSGMGVRDPLEVRPESGLEARGRPGGPFSPAQTTYTLTNSSATALQWEASTGAHWLEVEPAEGTIAAQESNSLALRLAPQAYLLGEGTAATTLTIRNTMTGLAQTRHVLLIVARSPDIVTSPSALEAHLLVGNSTTVSLAIGNGASADADLDFMLAARETTRTLGLAPAVRATAAALRSERSARLARAAAGVGAPPPERNFSRIAPEPLGEPDRILVRFAPRAKGARRAGALRAVRGASIAREYGLVPGLCAVQLPPGQNLEEALEAFNASEDVLYAQPSYRQRACQTLPNDARFSEQWALRNVGQTGGTPGADIGAAAAWDIATDASEVIVAVIDSGVDYTHPDLLGNMWTNPGETPGNGVDDDANGYVDDVYGYDFRSGDAEPLDIDGHGTHSAGTIGAVGNNGQGTAGVCWRARIMALRFLDEQGYGDTADAIAAIEYATMMGAQVMNNSWGGGAYEQALKDAIDAAGAAGIVFVAAAGNDGGNNDSVPFYPACFDSSNIISVLSTDHKDRLASSSSYGAKSVDLAAPGEAILSLSVGGGYRLMNGTSMATPQVAGACALLRAANPTLSVEELRQTLLSTVDPVLADYCVSGGRLNLGRALAQVTAKWIAFDPAVVSDLAPGASTRIAVRFDASDLESGTYQADIIVRSNDARRPKVLVPVTLRVSQANLDVAPTGVFAPAGPGGGPFEPSSQAYCITNTGSEPFDWSAAADVQWMEIAPSSGTLAAGASTTATARIGVWASVLTEGNHAATLVFRNELNGAVRSRHVALRVGPRRAPVLYSFPLDAKPDWSAQGEWAFGEPAGFGGDANGWPDPTGGATGRKVWGMNLQGDYAMIPGGPWYLTAGPFDLSSFVDTQLRFQRWLNIDGQPSAVATIGVSNDAVHWTTVWQNDAGQPITDSAWISCQYAISAVADRAERVYLRWGYATDGLSSGGAFSGWNIDDIEIVGNPVSGLALYPPDGFEVSGDTGGPFDPPAATYILTNLSSAPLAWSAQSDALWLDAVPASGTLAPGAMRTVSLELNDAALALAIGRYAGVVTFADSAREGTQLRKVALDIRSVPGRIEARDSIAPEDDGAMPFGLVATGRQSTATLTVRNTHAEHSLVLSDLWIDFVSGAPKVNASNLRGATSRWPFRLVDIPELPRVLAPGEEIEMQVVYQPSSAGEHSAFVAIQSNDADEPDLLIALSGSSLASLLAVEPAGVFSPSGHPGGPFSPSSTSYVLSNIGSVPVAWNAVASAAWLRVEPIGGTLASGSSTTVALSLAGEAAFLGEGLWNASVSFRNPDNGVAHVRDVDLRVFTTPEPRFEPEALWIEAAPGELTTRTLTVENADTADGRLSFALRSSAPWLSAGPSSATAIAPGESLALAVACDARALEAGMYYGKLTFAIDAFGASDRTVEVAMRVRRDDLVVTPEAGVGLVGKQGGPFSAARALALKNQGEEPLYWRARPGAEWLEATPRRGILMPGASTSVTLNATAQANVLEEGRYGAALQVENLSSGAAFVREVALDVRAAAGEAVLTDTVAPKNDLDMPFGSLEVGRVTTESIVVHNADVQRPLAVLSIELEPLAGDAAPSVYSISHGPDLPCVVEPGGSCRFDVSFLPAEYRAYEAVVRIATNDSAHAFTEIHLSGAGTESALALESEADFRATGFPGGPFEPTSQSLTLRNTGPTLTLWDAATDVAWLSLSPASGTLSPGTDVEVVARLTGDAAALGLGQHGGQISIHNRKTDVVHTRDALLEIVERPAPIVAAPQALAPRCDQGEQAAADTLEVSSQDGISFDFTVSDNADWLSVSPPEGSASATLRVDYDTSGLAEGIHEANIVIRGAAEQTPRVVPVALTVGPPKPRLGLSVQSLNPLCALGDDAPDQVFQIENLGGGSSAFSISTDAAWLEALPSGAVLTDSPTSITVRYATSELAEGVHHAELRIVAPGAVGSPAIVDVTLRVYGEPSVRLLDFAGAPGGAALLRIAQTDASGSLAQFAFAIDYPADLLEFQPAPQSDVRGTLTNGAAWDVVAQEMHAGRIEIFGSAQGEATSPGASGTLAEVRFRVRDDAPSGAVDALEASGFARDLADTVPLHCAFRVASATAPALASDSDTLSPPAPFEPTLRGEEEESLTILLPSSDISVSSATMQALFRGAASDKTTRVEYRTGSGPWTEAQGKASWRFAVDLDVGVNAIEVRAIDDAGEPSAVARRTVTRALLEARRDLYAFPLDQEPTWTTQGQWAFGAPTGGGGALGGYPDPAGGSVYGVNLSGDYSVEAGGSYALEAGPFDFADFADARLRFRRWLNTDARPWVTAAVEARSGSEGAWVRLWENGAEAPLVENAWRDVAYDLSAVADGQADVYVRWLYAVGPDADGSGPLPFSGWNIDDVALEATPATPAIATSPTALDFGVAGPEASPFVPRHVTIRNLGNAALLFDRVEILGTGADAFELSGSDMLEPLGPGASRSIAVTFAPKGSGRYEAEMQIATNDPKRPLAIIPVAGRVILAAPTMETEPVWTAGTANTVRWSASPGAARYELERAASDDFEPPTGSVEAASTTLAHTFKALEDGQTYWYRIRAFDAWDAPSAWSDPVFSTQDATAPSASLACDAPNRTNRSPLSVSIVLSEPVAAFTSSSLGVTNAEVLRFVGAGTSFTLDLAPLTQGEVLARIAPGGLVDHAGNANASAIVLTRQFDSIAPTVALSSASPPATNRWPIRVAVQLSEPSSDFAVGDVRLANASLLSFGGSGAAYTLDLKPLADGEVRASVAAGAFADGAGNANATSVTLSRLFDTIAPQGALDINGGEAISHSPDVTLYPWAADSGSGVAAMHFSEEGEAWSAWEPYDPNPRAWMLLGGEGLATLHAEYRDVAGNVSTQAILATILYLTSPSLPSDPQPADGARGVATTATLAWGGAERADSFDLYLWQGAEARPAEPTTSGLAVPAFAPGALAPSMPYRWQVVARNAAGSSAGPVWEFETGLPTDIRTMTEYFYLTALARPPEPGALDAWQHGYYEEALALRIDVRFVLREMGRQFFLSAEYEARERSDAEFIVDCYEAFLLRTPGDHEVASWTSDVDEHGNVRWNRGQVMTGFAESAEFEDLILALFPGQGGEPARNFVATMYLGIFDRLADPDGLGYWAGRMESAGEKRDAAKEMAEEFFESEEGRQKASTNALRVVRLYRAFLGRYPAPHESAYWQGELDSGNRALSDLIELFADSEEFSAILEAHFPTAALR